VDRADLAILLPAEFVVQLIQKSWIPIEVDLLKEGRFQGIGQQRARAYQFRSGSCLGVLFSSEKSSAATTVLNVKATIKVNNILLSFISVHL